MTAFTEVRLRSKLNTAAIEDRIAKILRPGDFDLLITGPTRAYRPDGSLLCVYLPGAVKEQMTAAYDILTTIGGPTENRGYASGTAAKVQQGNQQRGKPVTSAIIGAFESSGHYKFCRLTSWTAKQMKGQWPELFPLFQAAADRFEEYVPDRYATQYGRAVSTPREWIIEGTPFTTVTVNDTYPTGVHKDKGDLDEGFSCLAVGRRGSYAGGCLTFPEYRVAVDLQDGDLILMNAHDWHGNTQMFCQCGAEMGQSEGHRGTGPCKECGARRISVVLYYRTKMASCGTIEEEQEKQMAWAERRNAGPAPSPEEEMAALTVTTETLL